MRVGRWESFGILDGLPGLNVPAIMEDREGCLWFGTWGCGASRYDGENFVNFTTEDGLADNYAKYIMEDRKGYLWFATNGGVSRYDGESFVNLTDEDGLASNAVNCILEDREGYLWFGTNGGVSRYDGDSFVNFTVEDGLAYDAIMCILEDSEGDLWFGTWNAGVSRYNGRSFVNFAVEDGLSDNRVVSIAEDREGNLWFAGGRRDTEGGVTRYDGDSFVNFMVEDGLADNLVRCILEDREGHLWFGTTRSGVSRYDGQGFQTMSVKDGLSCNFIGCILEDREGYLWFGTNGGGVCKYDGRNFQEITSRDGLSHDVVEQIIQDKAGNFWFATPNGVTRYTPPAQEVKPRVRITQATADRVYEKPDSIETSARQMTFEYKGLSFRTKFDRINYVYRLETSDVRPETSDSKPSSLKSQVSSLNNWSRATRERRVSYENLEPGEYLFQVKAIDRDLNYSDAAQVKLKVIPDPRNHRIAQLEGELEERERAEMERMQRELEDARQIQQSLLPKGPPRIEGFEIAGTSLPAKEVSGDFYDYLSLGQNVGVVLADVTGKSVKAAMIAALADGMLDAEIKGQRELWDSPSKILGELNMGLKPRLVRGMFTAMSLGIICTDERKLLFSNAGMPYPIVKRGKEARELEVVGMPLGLMEGAEYQDLRFEMKEGDLVVFYSDGVIEATDETGEMYQTEQLLELIQQADPDLSAQEMVDLIVRDVTEFVGGEETSDDITIVVIVCKE